MPLSPARAPLGTGLLAGIGANIAWGGTFLVEQIAPASIPALALAIGRYAVFGLLSLVLVLRSRRMLRSLALRDWALALVFSATGHVGQFVLVLLSVRYAGGPTATIVCGVLPVTIAVYGNLRRRELPMRHLLWPLVITTAGIALLSGQTLAGTRVAHPAAYALGVGFALVAVAAWTWFAEANSTFLKRHPQLSGSDWAGCVGLASLPLAAVLLPFAAHQLRTQPPLTHNTWLWLAGASLGLGVIVSWLATVLWNRASTALPVSLAGQLIVVETVAGLIMVHLASLSWPSWWELAGFVVSTVGVIAAIRVTMPRSSTAEAASAATVEAFRRGGSGTPESRTAAR